MNVVWKVFIVLLFMGVSAFGGLKVGTYHVEKKLNQHITYTDRIFQNALLSEFIQLKEFEDIITSGDTEKFTQQITERKSILANILHSSCEEETRCDFTWPILYAKHKAEITQLAVARKTKKKDKSKRTY